MLYIIIDKVVSNTILEMVVRMVILATLVYGCIDFYCISWFFAQAPRFIVSLSLFWASSMWIA